MIGKGKNEVGTASFSFQGASGEYNVILGTFDENDGNSTFEVSKNNNLIGAIDLNQNLGNNGATAKTKVERTIATAVAIAPGDNFTIKGMEVGKEHARFDFIKFIPVGNTDNVTTVTANDLNQPKPTVNNNNKAIRLEAEDADTLINYRQENIGAASGNKALSFIGQGENESGSVTFDFNGASDTYNLTIGTFDENDGVASFKVQHNDAETNRTTAIATLELDGNLGSNSANGKTFISPTVAFGINLTPGDSITVIGLENASEHARLDYLELISTDANI